MLHRIDNNNSIHLIFISILLILVPNITSQPKMSHYPGFPNRNFATENNPNDYFLPEEIA